MKTSLSVQKYTLLGACLFSLVKEDMYNSLAEKSSFISEMHR